MRSTPRRPQMGCNIDGRNVEARQVRNLGDTLKNIFMRAGKYDNKHGVGIMLNKKCDKNYRHRVHKRTRHHYNDRGEPPTHLTDECVQQANQWADQAQRETTATCYLWPLPVRSSRAQPAALAGKSIVQEGMAPATKDCTLRVQEVARLPLVHCVRASPLRRPHRGAPGFVRTRWLGAMVPLCRQGRRPLLWSHGQHLRFRTRTLGVGRSTWLEAVDRVCPSPPLAIQLTVPFQFLLDGPPHGGHLIDPRLALSHGCREDRKRHLRSRRCQRLTAERQAMNSPSDVQNTRNPSASLAFISLHAVWILCSPAAIRLRNQQQQSSYGASQTLGSGQERSRRARNLLVQAAVWAPRHHPRGPCRVSRSQRDNARSLAWAGRSRIPAVANAAGRAAPCNGTVRLPLPP